MNSLFSFPKCNCCKSYKTVATRARKTCYLAGDNSTRGVRRIRIKTSRRRTFSYLRRRRQTRRTAFTATGGGWGGCEMDRAIVPGGRFMAAGWKLCCSWATTHGNILFLFLNQTDDEFLFYFNFNSNPIIVFIYHRVYEMSNADWFTATRDQFIVCYGRWKRVRSLIYAHGTIVKYKRFSVLPTHTVTYLVTRQLKIPKISEKRNNDSAL